MQPKNICLVIILYLIVQPLFAQRDAPVAGHAANLVDLLKKDYNGIDPELRGDEIIRDRGLVISIFKAYMTDAQRSQLVTAEVKLNKQFHRVDSVLVKLNAARKAYAGISSNITATATTIIDISKNTNSLSEKQDTIKTRYLIEKAKLDIAELNLVSEQYQTGYNEYIVYVIKLFEKKYGQLIVGADGFAVANYTSTITKSIPFIGGELAFETVIDGLSRFLAKRIKEELTNEVIKNVQAWLSQDGDKDPLAEFKIMLPRTTRYLRNFQAEKVTSFPDEIKQYIEDDLNHALANAAELKNTPKIRKLIEEHPDLDFALEAIELIPELSKLKNPADYFKTIENSRNLRHWKRNGSSPALFNIANLIQLSCMIGQSMTLVDNGELRFAGKDFMGSYVGEKNFYLLYLGFLYQQNIKYYSIEFQYSPQSHRDNLVLAPRLNYIVSRPINSELLEERRFFNFMLTGIGENAEKVLVSATEIRKANKAGKKIGADSVFRFVESMINLSENVVFASGALVDYLEIGQAEHLARIRQGRSSLDQIAAPYFIVARSFNEIAFDIQKSKYANALLKVLELKEKLATDVAQSSINLAARVNQMSYIHTYPTVALWPVAIKYLKDGKDDIPELNVKAQSVINDIHYIHILAQEVYPVHVPPSLLTCFNDAEDLYNADMLDRTAASKLIDTLLANHDFRKLAIAYFTGIMPNTIVQNDEINIMRKRFPYESQRNIQLCDSLEIREIKNLANAYADELATVLISGKITEPILKAKSALEKRVDDYWKSFTISNIESPASQALTLIHFVNDMAVAKDAADVEKAIEAFALPAGSFVIKRKSRLNLSINSYPGILPAYEVPWGKNEAYNGANPTGKFSIGLTAPIGLSLAHGYNGCIKFMRGTSVGIFIPVIDIGAITRLRLDSDKNTTVLPKVTFENFISPGLYFHVGLRNTPLSVNFGGQFGPQLRKFTSKTDYITYDSMRFGIGLVLDIPLLNLYTKPRFEEP